MMGRFNEWLDALPDWAWFTYYGTVIVAIVVVGATGARDPMLGALGLFLLFWPMIGR